MSALPHLETMARPALIEYIGVLEGQIEALRAASQVDDTSVAQSAFRLTLTEARILDLLAKGEPKSKTAILHALYWDKSDDEWPGVKIVDVWICKIRHKLAGSGIGVKTLWGSGYQLTGLDRLVAVLAGEPPMMEEDALAAPVGRKEGTKIPGGHNVQAKAMDFLARNPRFSMREFSGAMRPHYSGVALIRQLEHKGLIRVVLASKSHKYASGIWQIEVLTP